MTPVFQTEKNQCLRACVASVFNLMLAEVPNFISGSKPNALLSKEDHEMLDQWMKDRGCQYVEVGLGGKNAFEVLQQLGGMAPNCLYLLTGRTNTHRAHCVVARGSVIIHDPAINDGTTHSLRGPCQDGYWRAGFFVKDL